MSTPPASPFGPLITAMVTPFAPDGAVDYARARELAARLIANGSTALVVAGTTGESPTLTHDEKLELFRCVREAAGDAPVIANTGSNDTAASVRLSREAQECGVAALLMVVPYYNRPNAEGLYRHFRTIAEAVNLPCILYNLPGRTSRNMEPATVARLSEVGNIAGVKESSGDPMQWTRTRALAADDFWLYSGNDLDTLPMLPLGACGVISVVSHIAGPLLRQMMDAFWNGDGETARALHLRLLPLCEALFPPSSPNPIPIKAALQLHGFDCGGLRLPLVEASPAECENLRAAMRQAQLI